MPSYRGISPEVNGGADLGSASQRWNKLYAQSIDAGTHVNGAFNKKVTFTSSGTFTAPVTGVYRITLQGGGGGGGGAGSWSGYHAGGAGGSSGAKYTMYAKMQAGTSYSYIIGAGGAGGAAGNSSTGGGGTGTNGGNSSVTVGVDTLVCNGGNGGSSGSGSMCGGYAMPAYLNNTVVAYSEPGGSSGGTGKDGSVTACLVGGSGGGIGGGRSEVSGYFGGGGGGGRIYSDATYTAGGAGGDGYITFEYYDPNA